MDAPLMLATGWFPDDTGGLSRYARELAEALDAAGSTSELVVAGPARGAPPWVTVAAPAASPLLRRLLGFRRATRDARSLDAHFALYALPALLGRRRRPLVVHFHGPWADEAAAAGKPSATAARRAIERFVYRRADALVTLSSAFAELLAARYGVPRDRIHVIPPGVDLERFRPGDRAAARRELGLDENAFVAVTARRLVPRMGIDVLLEAWRQAGIAHAQLLVAGDGPERERLEPGAPAGVTFAGRLDDDRLLAAYRAADVVVVPSRELEGFGLVVVEALACGTPVIATDAGGLPEALGGLGAGNLVPPGDAGALAARLRDAASGERPLPGGDACRAHAETFSWHAAAERHLELYRRLPEPPRVVFLDHTAVLAGGEVALLRLVAALGSDVDAHVILASDGPLAERLRAAGVSVEILPLRESARELGREHVGAVSSAVAVWRSAAYAFRVARRLRQLRPDVVHANSLKSDLYGGLAGRLARVPVVWHVRDRIAADYLPTRAVQLVHAAERLLASAVLVDTETVRATLARPGRAHVVPSPVQHAPAVTERAHGPLRVGMVARIAPWKGQDVFLDAFARAFGDGDERAVLVGAPLFGSDEEDYERGLHEQAARLGLDGRVEFRGFRDDVAAELASLDVLVHASVLPEPFGLSVVEGMTAGLAVVASDAGGPAEVIDDGVNGLLFPAGDADALAARLRSLADDGSLRGRLGDAGRTRAEAFAPAVVAARVLDVYAGVR